MPVEDVQSPDAFLFETFVGANPGSAEPSARVEAAGISCASRAILEVAVKEQSFQIGFTRQFEPLDDDESQQLHLVFPLRP
jgi:hypothetical protein